jgi:hypothetical protein
MTISQEEFGRIFNAIAFTITRIYYTTTGKEPTAAFVTTMTRRMIVDYLDEIGIDEVED